VLSRQRHFRDLLAGHDRQDGALRYAGLRAPSAKGRAIFAMCYGIQFRYPPRYANGPTARYMTHMFDMRCRENGIEHRFTKINHPWTNGQVERMNRTIKDATVRRYHYETNRQLQEHLGAFLDAYNFGRRLKTLKGLTPYEAICKAWAAEPERFRQDPAHLTSGLNT
jgi:hypothetical protein